MLKQGKETIKDKTLKVFKARLLKLGSLF